MNPITDLVTVIDEMDLWEGKKGLKRNEYLKVHGATDTNIYYVIEGSIRMYVIDEMEEHTIRFAYKDNVFGALESYITEKPSEMYIQALKKTDLKFLSKKKFEAFIDADMGRLKKWHQVLYALVIQQMERERDLLTSSPIERYNRVLARSPQLFQEIPHKFIASYLRMTPETLSRIKKS